MEEMLQFSPRSSLSRLKHVQTTSRQKYRPGDLQALQAGNDCSEAAKLPCAIAVLITTGIGIGSHSCVRKFLGHPRELDGADLGRC